jgi:hypothetical protein
MQVAQFNLGVDAPTGLEVQILAWIWRKWGRAVSPRPSASFCWDAVRQESARPAVTPYLELPLHGVLLLRTASSGG